VSIVGRGRDRRRERRKERAGVRKSELPPAPVNHERILARFRCLRGRAVALGFVPLGPTVEADTPEQLADAVERAAVEATRRQPPS
jgi:hypothetical protein